MQPSGDAASGPERQYTVRCRSQLPVAAAAEAVCAGQNGRAGTLEVHTLVDVGVGGDAPAPLGGLWNQAPARDAREKAAGLTRAAP
jgi:hypothetical protein